MFFLIFFFCFSGGRVFGHLLCPLQTPKENAARLCRYSATHDVPAGDLQAFGRDDEQDDADDEQDADDEEKEVESRATTKKTKKKKKEEEEEMKMHLATAKQ